MSDIRDKIKKLLAVANDKGASEAEAASAMQMAMGLMARHGIEASELQEKDVPKSKLGEKIRAKFDGYEVIIASASAYLYGCRLLCINKGKDGILFVGRPDNIEASEMTMLFLAKQLEALYKQALPAGLTKKERSSFRKRFKFACAERIQARAAKLMEEMRASDVAAQKATGRNALVVQGYFNQIMGEADQLVRELGTRQVKQPTVKPGHGSLEGWRAGEHVKLRQELN